MLYSDATIMDTTIGNDMERTNGKTGFVFIKVCCICGILFSFGTKRKKLYFPLFISPTRKNIAFVFFIVSRFFPYVNVLVRMKNSRSFAHFILVSLKWMISDAFSAGTTAYPSFM